jgi:hypothetical protein
MAVNRVGRICRANAGVQMGNDLMAIKIKVDPMRRAAPLATAQYAAVKGAGFVKVMNGEGKMKGTHKNRLRQMRRQGNARRAYPFHPLAV